MKTGRFIRLLAGGMAAHLMAAAFVICSLTPVWSLSILVSSEPATLSAVAPNGTITLGDGRSLRLVDLEAPQSDAAVAAWRSAVAALQGQTVLLKTQGPGIDRYGRVLAVVEKPDHLPLQSELVAGGYARVMPTMPMSFATSGLLADEDRARRARRGIWSEPAFAVIEADQVTKLEALAGRYALVEGKILDAVSRKDRLYFNFGSDWRTDFTVTVAPVDARLGVGWRKDGKLVPLPELIGQRVRVRGFITRYNGPEIIVTSSNQLEFVGQSATASED